MNIRLSIILLLCVLLSAWYVLQGYASGNSQDGLVVDAETGTPIPEAFVIGQWVTRGYARTICFHLSMTRTSIDGKYHLPAWRKKSKFGSSDQTVVLHAYKSGYFQQYSHRQGDARLRLEKVKVQPEEVEKRIGIIRRASSQISCRSAGESERNVLEFYKVLYKEAKSYSGEDSHKDINILLWLIEKIELGRSKAKLNYDSRINLEKKETRVLYIENTDLKALGPD